MNVHRHDGQCDGQQHVPIRRRSSPAPLGSQRSGERECRQGVRSSLLAELDGEWSAGDEYRGEEHRAMAAGELACQPGGHRDGGGPTEHRRQPDGQVRVAEDDHPSVQHQRVERRRWRRSQHGPDYLHRAAGHCQVRVVTLVEPDAMDGDTPEADAAPDERDHHYRQP